MTMGKNAGRQRAPLVGSSCQWVDLARVHQEGNGCTDGTKFVLKPKSGVRVDQHFDGDVLFQVRKQFLFVDGKTIVAFVTKGLKFADCSSISEVTARVQCKVREDREGEQGWCDHSVPLGGGRCGGGHHSR